MTIKQFNELHLNLKVRVIIPRELNKVDSATDPTQDIPIRNIEVTATGQPINVKEGKKVLSGVSIENMTTIEKRHTDKFDIIGDFQDSVSKVSRKGVTTNFKQTKKQKNHEE